MIVKDKLLSYLEIYVGWGFYDLGFEEVVKIGEVVVGIVIVEVWFDEDYFYCCVFVLVCVQFGENVYVGLFFLVVNLLWFLDKFYFVEFYFGEGDVFEDVMVMFLVKIYCQDGFVMVYVVCLLELWCGVLLIDLSYEIKIDFDCIFGIVGKLYKKWNVGVIVFWYLIFKDGSYLFMVMVLEFQNLFKILCYEVCFLFVKDKYWMIGFGMFFVNVFWGFEVEI